MTKEERRQYAKQWAEENKDHIKQYGKVYRFAHAEKLTAQASEYYQKNREAIDKRNREWREANRERFNAAARRRYLRKCINKFNRQKHD